MIQNPILIRKLCIILLSYLRIQCDVEDGVDAGWHFDTYCRNHWHHWTNSTIQRYTFIMFEYTYISNDITMLSCIKTMNTPKYCYLFDIKMWTKHNIPYGDQHKRYDICIPNTNRSALWSRLSDWRRTSGDLIVCRSYQII